jgi:hypothetical protein
LLGRLAIPANCFVEILRDAAALRVQGGQGRLRNGNAPFRGLTIPTGRLRIVARPCPSSYITPRSNAASRSPCPAALRNQRTASA